MVKINQLVRNPMKLLLLKRMPLHRLKRLQIGLPKRILSLKTIILRQQVSGVVARSSRFNHETFWEGNAMPFYSFVHAKRIFVSK